MVFGQEAQLIVVEKPIDTAHLARVNARSS